MERTEKPHVTMASSTGESNDGTISAIKSPVPSDPLRFVTVARDPMSFADRQKVLLTELDRRTFSELRRRQRDWQYSIQRMRSGFLRLLPDSDTFDPKSASSLTSSSNDVVPVHKVRAQYFEYSDDEIEGDDANVVDAMAPYKRESAAPNDAVAKCRGRYQLRFDVSNLVPSSVSVTVDDDAIVVRGLRPDTSPPSVTTNTGSSTTPTTLSADTRSYLRRVAKPDLIDRTRIRAFLSADGILTVEAPVSPNVTDGHLQVGERKTKASVEDRGGVLIRKGPVGTGKMTNGDKDKVQTKTKIVVNGVPEESSGIAAGGASVIEKASDKEEEGDDAETKKPIDSANNDDKIKLTADAVTKSPRGSTLDVHSSKVTTVDSPGGGSSGGTGGGTGEGSTPKEKIGVPIFRDESGTRRLHLAVDLGSIYKPRDVIVQVIKENRIQIRAKHREQSGERKSKNKFVKDYELGEKIEPFSLQGGLTASGKLIVCAYAKGHGPVAPE